MPGQFTPSAEDLKGDRQVTAVMLSAGRDPLTGIFHLPGETVQLPRRVAVEWRGRSHLRPATKDEKAAYEKQRSDSANAELETQQASDVDDEEGS